MPEAGLLKLCCHGEIVHGGVVVLLSFGWRDISDGFQKSASIEPVHPFQCCKLNGFE